MKIFLLFIFSKEYHDELLANAFEINLLLLILFVKATGGEGVNHLFYKLILFHRVFTEFEVASYGSKNSNWFLRYDWSKLGLITGT